MKNKYEVRGDLSVIFINSQKYGKMVATISTAKLIRADEFPNTWYAGWNDHTKTFYVLGNVSVGVNKRKTVTLHRWIMNPPEELVIDHINHDTLNNSDSNLRIVTNSENMQNQKIRSKKTFSGVACVQWHKRSKKWQARVTFNRKTHSLGYFTNLGDAEHAVMVAKNTHSTKASSL